MNKLNILYEDNQIIVVVKSVNILSQSDITGDSDMLTIIKNYLKDRSRIPTKFDVAVIILFNLIFLIYRINLMII